MRDVNELQIRCFKSKKHFFKDLIQSFEGATMLRHINDVIKQLERKFYAD